MRWSATGSDAGAANSAALNGTILDVRGAVAGRNGTARTSMTPVLTARLVAEHEDGASATNIASKLGKGGCRSPQARDGIR